MPTRQSIADVDAPARRRIYAAAASIAARAGIERDPTPPPSAGSDLAHQLAAAHDRQLLADVLEAIDRLLPDAPAKKRSTK